MNKKRVLLNRLDKEWRKKVIKRDEKRCQICKKKPTPRGLQAHHIIPREVKGMRHDLKNGITLCSHCHKWGILSPHQNPLYFTLWFHKNKPMTYIYLMKWIENECEY